MSRELAIAVLALLQAGFLAIAIVEVRRWRGLGSFLPRRQRTVRGVNLGLGWLTLLLVGALALDLLPPEPMVWRLGALLGVVALLVLVVALVLWDLREIAARRLDGEMDLWAEGARTVLERMKDRPRPRQ